MTPLRLLALALLAGVVAWPGVSLALDPATEAAMEADEVNQEHCANLYSARVDTAATSTVRVAEVWQRVSQVYDETKAPYLLYWRGALAQCLGRDEAAAADLQEFVDTQINATMFASLVRNADTRLRRLAGGAGIGQGAAAAFLRTGARLEVGARYLGGSGLTVLSCRDDGVWGTGQPINSGCVGGVNPKSAVGPAVAPLGLDVSVDGFFARPIGLGLRVFFDLGAPVNLPDARSPGPLLELRAGPTLRILNSVASGGRGGWFRATIRVAAAFGQMSPWAGQAKYINDLINFHDVGSWALRHVGPAATVGGAFEVGQATILEIEGRFALFVPMGSKGTPKIREGAAVDVRIAGEQTATVDDDVYRTEQIPAEYQPDTLGSGRMHAGLRIGVLVPVGKGAAAIGPFFDAALQETAIRFPDRAGDIWCAAGYDAAGDPLCSGDGDDRKVYSTQRDDILLRLGVQLRFGAGEL